MTNTPFLTKCEIISYFSTNYENQDWAKEYLAFHNLGVPYASGVFFGHLTVNERGIQEIDEAWLGLLQLLGVDEYAEIDSLNDLMEISNEQG